MKRKNGRSKSEPTQRSPRPLQAQLGRSPSRDTVRLVSRLLLAAIALYATVRAFTTSGTHSIPFDSSNRQSWVLKDVSRFEPGTEYSFIECDQPCYVISPPQSQPGIDPAGTPYVKVIFSPDSSLRNLRILLSRPTASNSFFPRRGLQASTHLLCDLRDYRPYAAIVPYASTIDRVGVSFTGRMLLSGIEIAGLAGPADYPLLFQNALSNDEPSTPHAINELFGVYVLGHGQTAWAFALLFLGSLLVFSFARTRYLHKTSMVLAGVALFLYLPWAIYLFTQVSLSAGHSSLRYGMYDECASRYGEDFASLSRVLFDQVPAGSRVHFIRRVIEAAPTEGNLAAFIHSTRFEPGEFGDADYYFGCKCPGIYDPARAQLTDPDSRKTVRVAPVYLQDDSFLLKAAK